MPFQPSLMFVVNARGLP